MPETLPPCALVIGDGIAGLGAAIVLARGGWRVALARGKADRRRHREHAHVTSRAVLGRLEAVAGGALSGWQMGAAAAWEATGRREDGPRAIICAEALRRALRQRADDAGVVTLDDVQFAPTPADGCWHWHGRRAAGTAQLLVDASGSAHALGRTPGVAVVVDELEGLDRCWSWIGTNDGPASPWLVCARAVTGSAILMRAPDGTVRLTVRSNTPDEPCPLAALDALLLGAGAGWAQRIGNIAFDPKPLRYDSPLARRSAVAQPEALPPMIRIGDALIQTAPRLGQGLAQITEHLAALEVGLACGTPMSDLQGAIDTLADTRWAGLMMLAGIGRIAA